MCWCVKQLCVITSAFSLWLQLVYMIHKQHIVLQCRYTGPLLSRLEPNITFIMCIYSSVLIVMLHWQLHVSVCVCVWGRDFEDPHLDTMRGSQLYVCPHVILLNLTSYSLTTLTAAQRWARGQETKCVVSMPTGQRAWCQRALTIAHVG